MKEPIKTAGERELDDFSDEETESKFIGFSVYIETLFNVELADVG